jgi:hypothetical protein
MKWSEETMNVTAGDEVYLSGKYHAHIVRVDSVTPSGRIKVVSPWTSGATLLFHSDGREYGARGNGLQIEPVTDRHRVAIERRDAIAHVVALTTPERLKKLTLEQLRSLTALLETLKT